MSALKDKLAKAMDDEVEVDFSGAGEGFNPIPSGDYELEVTECVPSMSKSNNQTVKFQFVIVEGEQHAGRVFFRHCPTGGSGSGILRDTARALGVNVDDKQKKFKPSECVGLRCIGTIGFQKGSDEYQEIKKCKALKASGTKATGAAKRTGLRK